MTNNNRLKEVLKSFRLNESTISMVLGALVVLVIGMLVLNYFRGVKRSGSETAPTVTKTTEVPETPALKDLPTTYKVNAGDSLWTIAENVYGSGYNWVDIAKENGLTNPNFLAVGQEITVPLAEVRQATTATVAIDSSQAVTGETYTVVKGDNLWNIAVRAYSDGYQWVKIASENNLAHPGLIHPGNVLRLPR